MNVTAKSIVTQFSNSDIGEDVNCGGIDMYDYFKNL